MGTLNELAKTIKKALERAKQNRDTNGVPLTGSNASNFVSDLNAAKTDSTDALADSFFDGPPPVIGTVKTQPGGTDLLDWLVTLGSAAETTVNLTSPTPAQVQDAADDFKTIGANAATCISQNT